MAGAKLNYEKSISEDDSYSMIERLADAIRIEDDVRLSTEDRTRIVQDLYEGPRKCQCCINWVDEVPADAEIDVVEKEDDSHPLILRRRVMPGEDKTQVSVHSIEVRHPGARAVLFDVFSGLDGIIPEVKYLYFKPPFHQFFWRWDRFEKAIEEQEDEYVKTILIQLRAIVRKDLAGAFVVSDELTSHGVITHQYLWTIFLPGELIFYNNGGPEQFFILQSSYSRQRLGSPYELNCQFVDWTGSKFGFNSTSLTMWKFKGTRKINELLAFPAKYLDNYDEVRARCIERGRRVVDLAGIQYKGYRSNGRPDGPRAKGGKAQHIDRRIILDAGGHPDPPDVTPLKAPHELAFSTGLITQAPLNNVPPGGHRPLSTTNPAPARAPAGPHPGMPMRPPGMKPPPRRSSSNESLSSCYTESETSGDDEETKEKTKKPLLTDDQLQLTSAFVLGFCLKEKKWRTFDVSRVYDIDWNTTPFESLVLPEGYKDLILSFVESQLKDGDTFDDVINGKGGGLVILLSGDPGVGKTLTAESVAEKIQAPLYKLELVHSRSHDGDSDDSDSSDDESDDTFIKNAFERAARWKAVLLIDECDMYLEARSDASPKRNRLVARFLQKLEYYPSLLFLTTNRERVLDPAIYSRIHLTINYPALDVPSRKIIWNTFLTRDGETTVTEKQLNKLAEIELNGRRIRNISKTARIMAKRQSTGVSYEHIRHVLRITEGLSIGESSQNS